MEGADASVSKVLEDSKVQKEPQLTSVDVDTLQYSHVNTFYCCFVVVNVKITAETSP